MKAAQGAPLLAGFARGGAFSKLGKICFVRDEITDKRMRDFYSADMPWGLKRFCETGALHFATWSCYDRLPLLDSDVAIFYLRFSNRCGTGIVS